MNCFNIAVAGGVKKGENKAVLARAVSNLLTETQLRINDLLPSGDKCALQLVAHKGLSDKFWSDVADENRMELRWLEETASNEQTPVRRAVSVDELLTYADLVIMLWDETFTGAEGIIWDQIKKSKEMNIPCIWISKNAPYDVYWANVGYFQKYENSYLREYIAAAFHKEEPEQAAKKVPLIAVGEKLYSRYLKKYRADKIPNTYENDVLIDKDFSSSECGNETVRKKLLKNFLSYDGAAIDLASKYRASIYFRAILPFIANVFIAVGFYCETLCGFVFGSFSIGNFDLWEVLAGVGFLLHAGVNFYAYYLSKCKSVKNWHKGFLNNRLIAEILRLYIHLSPFGYSVNLRTLMHKCGINAEQSPQIYSTLRKILREAEDLSVEKTDKDRRQCLTYLKGLIDDQIVYHKKSAVRYEKIAAKLSKLGRIAFYAGFVIVLLRGCLQFSMFAINWDFSCNGIALKSFVSSFANLFALFIPAWASYFTSKLSLCEFDFMKENDRAMTIKLEKCKKTLEDAENHALSPDVFQTLIEQTAETVLGEVHGWYDELSKMVLTNM